MAAATLRRSHWLIIWPICKDAAEVITEERHGEMMFAHVRDCAGWSGIVARLIHCCGEIVHPALIWDLDRRDARRGKQV